MAFLVSPGVAVVEKDFTSIVPAVSTSVGAFAGAFSWGPIEEPVRISSETELVAKFGRPTDGNYQSFFSAANFLGYTNTLLVNRVDADGLFNATDRLSGGINTVALIPTEPGAGYTEEEIDSAVVTFSAPQIAAGEVAKGSIVWFKYDTNANLYRVQAIQITDPGTGYTAPPTVSITGPLAGTAAQARVTPAQMSFTGVKIKNIDDYLENYGNNYALKGTFAAKFSGSRANGVEVYVIDANNWDSLSTIIKRQFSGKPGTSDYAAANIPGTANDELHILVVDNSKGSFSGVAGTILEKFEFLSKLSDAKKSDGTSIYWKEVINFTSQYLWALTTPSNTINSVSPVIISDDGVTFTGASESSPGGNTISSTANLAELGVFKEFFDAQTHPVQIKVSGSDFNDGVFTVLSVSTVLTDGVITGYTITVTEQLTSDTDSSVTLERVALEAWGQSAQQVVENAVGIPQLDLIAPGFNSVTLIGGSDDFSLTDGNVQSAYAEFSNADKYDISLVVTGNVSATTANFIISNVAEVRKDCVVFVSPRNTTAGMSHWITATQAGVAPTTAAIQYKNAVNISTSYAVMDSGWKYQYDRYNDKYRWVPLNGDTAGLCARVDFTADPWYSPGGFNRGQIKNVVKLGYNPNQTQRDELYQEGINPVVTFPGQGTVLFGDKTMLAKPSAFDRINVRRLFIVLEKAVATAAKFQLFEFNDSFTRAQFRNLVEPFLRDVQGRRGVTDFRVVCDDTNNTGEVIDRNEFVADIFIKPNRSINFITLTFVAARSSVSFEEIGA